MPSSIYSLSFILAIGIFCSNCAIDNNTSEKLKPEVFLNDSLSIQAIKKTMKDQEEAWNSFDLEGFMNGYWQSDSLQFIGSRGLTKGWDSTLENYKNSYPNQDRMGRLKFDIHELRRIGPKCFFMIGTYTLYREEDQPFGYFNLLWEYKKNKWIITTDHSS